MSNYTIKAKNKKTNEIVEFTAIDNYYGRRRYGYVTNNEIREVCGEDQFNDLFEVVEDNKIIIQPSGRIDYCCMCNSEHGYDCPLDRPQTDTDNNFKYICKHSYGSDKPCNECQKTNTYEEIQPLDLQLAIDPQLACIQPIKKVNEIIKKLK